MKKIFFFLFCTTWCLVGSDISSDTSFKATVTGYRPKGFRRSFTVRDVAILQIKEPKYFQNKELKIVLNDRNSEFWSKVGRSILFSASHSEIDEATKADSSIILFESALMSVRPDDGKSNQ